MATEQITNGVDQVSLEDKAAQKKADKEKAKEAAKAARKAQPKEKKVDAPKKGANYNILKNHSGPIKTRFPPEPSGYLHIGHAKAALLNDYFAKEYQEGGGTLQLRLDDTNPSKETEEFQNEILRDLELLGIKPDLTSHTSDYFEKLYETCVQLIKAGKAYADDSDQETMAKQRSITKEQPIPLPSARRDESVEDNLARFAEMKTGSEGQRWCIRAKIDYKHKNAAMRDPTIYRCNSTPHHRTGTTWKIYPLYDFAVAVCDSWEGITLMLRTIEYHDHNAIYHWIQEQLGLKPVEIFDFSKITFTKTVLSKRKLAQLVKYDVVSGWDDPRMPTVRGMRRRGMTVEALREFMVSQGPSKNIVNMDWDKIWTMNKKVIDQIAKRYTAVSRDHAVECKIADRLSKDQRDGEPQASAWSEDKPTHARDTSLGTKKVYFSNSVLLDQEDAVSFEDDEEITLMNWGNAFVRKKHFSSGSSGPISGIDLEMNVDGDFKTTKKKVTWLSTDQELVPVELADYGYLFTKEKLEDEDTDIIKTAKSKEDIAKCKVFNTQNEERVSAWADCNVKDVKENDFIQFDRKGYFRCDKAAGANGEPGVFFQVPTGKTK